MLKIQSSQPLWLKLLPKTLALKFINKKELVAVINNGAWLLFDKLVRLLLGLLVSAWVARYLGPAQFGELSYVLAYLAFFQTVSILGMDGIIVRDIARDNNKAGEILGTAFVLRLAVGTVCWLIAVGGMIIVNGWQDRSVYITALAGAILIFQAVDTIDLWFQSQSQSRRTVIAKLFSYFISSGIKVALILSKAPLIAFAVVVALETLISAIALIYAYRKFPCGNSWVYLKKKASEIINESWPFILSGLSIAIYMRIDQIMIKEFLTDADLGIYAAVLPLATLWSFIPVTLSVSLAPLVARKKQQGENEYWGCLSNIFRIFAMQAWIISIPIALLSNTIVNILLGQEYRGGTIILSIVVFSNVFISMGIAQSLWILNERKSKISLYRTVIGAIVCVVSNLIMIPKFGITGAAISALLAQAFSSFLANFVLCRKIFYMQFFSLFLMKFK
ncbi:flippase [Citrobacter amalonaticus]|uniref:Flippase n=1 Tax=Citrobacter amalonaticus TaxID=35703 RepID=A0A8I0MM37_CITAM|nr:flippase [Citrobacter amalonaticus]MBE0129295.1 flippase [Citrobacter amalonaticus]MEC5724694.1 flippase [Citrobacter amalonaticus]